MTMLGSPPPAPTGPALVRSADALDDMGEAPAWSLARTERRQDLLPRLTRAEARPAEAVLRVLREADRRSVGAGVGATTTRRT